MRSVESATASIHHKKSMVMQKRASSLLSSNKAYSPDDTSLDVSAHPISTTSEKDGQLSSSASSSQKYMEKVRYLESEMERVRGGVKLLGRSVERLNEAVVYDSRCCGGLTDALSFALGSCFESMRGGASSAAAKNEYSSVQLLSLDDSRHDLLSHSDDDDDTGDVHELHSDSSVL